MIETYVSNSKKKNIPREAEDQSEQRNRGTL